LTPRSVPDLSTTDRGLLPGSPAITRTGLAPAGLVQFSGRNTQQGYPQSALGELSVLVFGGHSLDLGQQASLRIVEEWCVSEVHETRMAR
jgi:hypothetical protein